MDEMSSNQHSSAYSSLANSTTEIHDIAKMEGEAGGAGGGGCRAGKGNRRTAVDLQMRAITEDYNALLRRATEQIRCAMLEVSLPLGIRRCTHFQITSKCKMCKKGLRQHFSMAVFALNARP